MSLPLLLAALATGSGLPAELRGLWLQDCRGGHQRRQLFTRELSVYSEMSFADAACSEPLLELVSEGDPLVGGLAEGSSGALEIDLSIERITAVPHAESVAAAFRARAVCGISTWEVGREQEVTGLPCDFSSLGHPLRMPGRAERRFGLVRREDDRLYFGRLSPARDGTGPGRRPLELDPAPYHFLPFF